MELYRAANHSGDRWGKSNQKPTLGNLILPIFREYEDLRLPLLDQYLEKAMDECLREWGNVPVYNPNNFLEGNKSLIKWNIVGLIGLEILEPIVDNKSLALLVHLISLHYNQFIEKVNTDSINMIAAVSKSLSEGFVSLEDYSFMLGLWVEIALEAQCYLVGVSQNLGSKALVMPMEWQKYIVSASLSTVVLRIENIATKRMFNPWEKAFLEKLKKELPKGEIMDLSRFIDKRKSTFKGWWTV